MADQLKELLQAIAEHDALPATILLPQQRCRIHGFRDARPELTQEDYDSLAE